MNPSDFIVTERFPPLVGSLGSAECEHTAAVLLVACQRRGTMGPVSPREAGEAWQSVRAYSTNPFFKIAPSALVAAGFARWVGEESEGRKRSLELTDECVERLRAKGYVRTPETVTT